MARKRSIDATVLVHRVGGRILNGQSFDVIVIDEAAQAAEPACWIPIAQLPQAKQLILVSHWSEITEFAQTCALTVIFTLGR